MRTRAPVRRPSARLASMFQDAPSPDVGSEISRADRCYLAQDWAAALALYESVERAAPALAAPLSLPLVIGHCRIELADDAALPAPTPGMAATHTAREQYAVKVLRARALEMCRAGGFARASQLLRLLAPYDVAIADAYRHGLEPGRSERRRALPDGSDPPFLRALDVATLPVDALKHAHRGKRLLLVYRRFFPEGDGRQSEVIHCLADSATRFGLAVTEFTFQGADPAELAPALLRTVLALKPDIIVYDQQYPGTKSAEPEILREQIEAVFAMARQQLGVRVVLSYMDAWQPMQSGSEAMFRGLGQAYDLVQHGHATALGAGTPEQNARAYCYMLPAWAAEPSVAPGTVPRACFAGSITWFNVARLAWWAETARRGLPIDFRETLHNEGAPRSDQAYVDLLVQYQLALNFTRRADGPKIMTARSLEIPLAGGLLLEENSPNSEFFLAPDVHYVPFETIDDLAALLPALLADPVRRERIRTAGQRWVQTYFTGDYFWAGLLRQLADLPSA
jgi:hypothetical protein